MASRRDTQPPPVAPDLEPDLHPAFVAELERRCDELDQGTAVTVGLRAALERARARRR